MDELMGTLEVDEQELVYKILPKIGKAIALNATLKVDISFSTLNIVIDFDDYSEDDQGYCWIKRLPLGQKL